MKADHILVVMNGEIIEEGSHEELIHKKGKYQNLWSKQLFVKPADECNRSRSPQKRDANIINDLTPNRQTTELAKVLKTTPHEEPSKNQATQDVGRKPAGSDNPCGGYKDESTQGVVRKSDGSDDPCGGHKREVSADTE
jgi:ABC-type multidrug transport system ATPase subunit